MSVMRHSALILFLLPLLLLAMIQCNCHFLELSRVGHVCDNYEKTIPAETPWDKESIICLLYIYIYIKVLLLI